MIEKYWFKKTLFGLFIFFGFRVNTGTTGLIPERNFRRT